MSDLNWKDAGSMDRSDLYADMEELASDAEANAKAHGHSEEYAWLRYADVIRAAIRKLKEDEVS